MRRRFNTLQLCSCPEVKWILENENNVEMVATKKSEFEVKTFPLVLDRLYDTFLLLFFFSPKGPLKFLHQNVII